MADVSANDNVKTLDSLSANEFAVEIDGERVSGIFKVTEFHSFKLDVKTTTTLKVMQEPFKIIKMAQRDGNNTINKWIRESIKAKADIARPTRTVAILALDDGLETRRWTVKEAWISQINYSDFDTGSGELVEETLLIQYKEIEETWPATRNLE